MRNLKRWLQLQRLIIQLLMRSSITIFYHLALYINTILSYLYWLIILLRRIFEKIRRLKKHRILAGLIHFSRLKLAFFKKMNFLTTQTVEQKPAFSPFYASLALNIFLSLFSLFVFSRGHATLHLAVSVRPSIRHISELRAVFALPPLPNRLRLSCRVSGLVFISLYS